MRIHLVKVSEPCNTVVLEVDVDQELIVCGVSASGSDGLHMYFMIMKSLAASMYSFAAGIT